MLTKWGHILGYEITCVDVSILYIYILFVPGGDLELLLPPLDDILTARELADLVSDTRFRFLLQYGYQCVVAPQDDIDDQ